MMIQVFDPPMCCSTGVCGPSVDPNLVRFAADLRWLRSNGVEVVRYNLSQQPAAFVSSPVVKAALARTGNACLPLTLADGVIVCEGTYPSREMLATWAGLSGAPDAKANAAPSCCGGATSQATFFKGQDKRKRCC